MGPGSNESEGKSFTSKRLNNVFSREFCRRSKAFTVAGCLLYYIQSCTFSKWALQNGTWPPLTSSGLAPCLAPSWILHYVEWLSKILTDCKCNLSERRMWTYISRAGPPICLISGALMERRRCQIDQTTNSVKPELMGLREDRREPSEWIPNVLEERVE